MTHAHCSPADDFHQRTAGTVFRKGPKQMLCTDCFCWPVTSLPGRVLGATLVWNEKRGREKRVGRIYQSPRKLLLKLNSVRSCTYRRLAWKNHLAACYNQNSRDMKPVMKKMENNETFLHCISQTKSACTANFTVFNARFGFGSVRNNLHWLHICGVIIYISKCFFNVFFYLTFAIK